MTFDEILGIHGVVLRSEDPVRDARAWRRALGLAPPRMARGEVRLGRPEVFVTLRRCAHGTPPGVEEVHVAVRGLRGARNEVDELGGRTVERRVGGVRLIVREFVAAPRSARRRPRRETKKRPGRGRARGSAPRPGERS